MFNNPVGTQLVEEGPGGLALMSVLPGFSPQLFNLGSIKPTEKSPAW